MRRIRVACGAVLLTVGAIVLAAPVSGSGASPSEAIRLDDRAEDLSGRQIMERVNARDDGDNTVSDLEMVLIDKRGSKRTRRLRSFVKDYGDDTYQLMFFLNPADVRNTGFLTYDYDDPSAKDDQWIYLPALNKTKRIAAGDKSGSFMGTDFSFADMTERPLSRYEYELLKESEVGGHDVWLIAATPRTRKEIEETGYTKSVLFVRKDNFVVVRSVNWVEKGERLKYLDVKRLGQIDGVWVATEVHMTTKQGRETLHKTILSVSNVRFDQDLPDGKFQLRSLERGL